MFTTRYKAVLVACAVASTLLLGCRTKFHHHDLPDNHLSFPAEGGTIEYVTQNPTTLIFYGIYINGEEIPSVSVEDESGVSVERGGWISFIYGYRIGLGHYTYLIKTEPNTSGKAREAVINVGVSAKGYGELYIHQAGQ